MFTKEQEEYLIRRLNRNEVVLFTGAGFSADAINLQGENMPIGGTLSKKIYEFLFPGITFINDGTSLKDMYQALLASGKKYTEISEFLEKNLLVKSYPDYFKYLTLPFWYRIYTINVDNLIEKIYDRFGGATKIESTAYPSIGYKERDQLLEKIQGYYLHGKLPCPPSDIIFSRSQYANSANKLQPLYFHFVQDFATSPTIFIGTQIDEPLFEQYIATRQTLSTGVSERRPKSFLIIPDISPIREMNLKNDYNVEVVKGYTEDFMNWIANKSNLLLAKETLLRTLLPTIGKIESHPRFSEHYSRNIKEFSQSFQKIELKKKNPEKKKQFLLGTTPTWSDIHHELDAPRNLTNSIYELIENQYIGESVIRSIAILGTAGSGKSTILKRLCYMLVQNGRSVYFSHSENLPKANDFISTIEMFNQRVIIAIDNAELVLRQLVDITTQLNKIKYPPIFILASRTNIFDRISSRYEPLRNLTHFELEDLTRNEIIGVIQKLDENNLLGKLKGLSNSLRINEFEKKAKKQILVAMREVTQGEDFDKIMKSEFEEISNEEAKILCLCISLTTEAGFTITKQDLVSFAAVPPAEALQYLEKELKGLVLKVGIKDDKLMLRHRMIANFIIDNCSKPDMLKQAYIRVLSSLASEINASTKNSRKLELYKEIINHYRIYKRFAKKISLAKEVYDSLTDYFRDDYQFWLQYGSLELEGVGGNIDIAENYINQALSLNNASIVKKTLANLYYKKSLRVSSKVEGDTFKEKGNEILLPFIIDSRFNDPYAFHIYGKGNYNYAINWLSEKLELRTSLKDLLIVIEDGCDIYPANKNIRIIRETIEKAILLTAVNGQVKYPIIYSDFD